MILTCNGQQLEHDFAPVPLLFENASYSNVFADKNNKTVAETIQHKRYAKFADRVKSAYSDFVDWPLGKFLLHLKAQDDTFYTQFLNKYGDQSFCRFSIQDDRFLGLRGVYVFTLQSDVQYIGRCRDNFRKRINQGYGKIHPKNCFIDGQATNCHLNALVATHQQHVRFAVLPLTDVQRIESLERDLIGRFNPAWNIALKTRSTI